MSTQRTTLNCFISFFLSQLFLVSRTFISHFFKLFSSRNISFHFLWQQQKSFFFFFHQIFFAESDTKSIAESFFVSHRDNFCFCCLQQNRKRQFVKACCLLACSHKCFYFALPRF